ncbi:type II secretion system protein GspM [Curvibacter sp. HBC61]|uniref:Type II secretion system protein GspM n=1 Tax=Curvibacter cyanobacteriorum TaxID=3026422 RepID=A0ABT5MYQ1_9BURK|nr:type II secretion system protein GspM [Curvibacter sp. HBC61]MDD0839015.1 type II secretion system protein GspM [Curvibacter sp. HBC61]
MSQVLRTARDRSVLVLLGLLLLAPVLALAAYVAYKHQWASEQMAQLEPRYARLLGLEQQRDKLQTLAQQSAALVAQYAYPESQEATQAGNDAQRRVRDVFAKARLEVMSSQVLPAKQEKQFDRIPVVVRYEGQLTALQSAFVALAADPGPAILVEGFTAQTIGVVKAETPQMLGGQINLYVLRVHP